MVVSEGQRPRCVAILVLGMEVSSLEKRARSTGPHTGYGETHTCNEYIHNDLISLHCSHHQTSVAILKLTADDEAVSDRGLRQTEMAIPQFHVCLVFQQ